MKRIYLFILAILAVGQAVAQCYKPNVDKANAEYAKGNYSKAYEHYQRATKCPDASRFDNGKAAKAGIRNCQPTLKIDGQNELNITIGRNAGEHTFNVTSSRLDSDGWRIGSTQNCEVVKEDHQSNTITIKWEDNDYVTNKTISFYISGYGVNYVNAGVEITQQGWPDKTITLPPGEKYDTIIKGTSGISFVLYHGKCGYIDSLGNEITPLRYTITKDISKYNDGDTKERWGKYDMLVRVYCNGKYGYINREGREVVPLQYDFIGKASMRYGISTTSIRKNGKYGLLGGNGKEIVPCIYDGFRGGSYHSDDIQPIAFKKNSKWALFDRTGKQLTSFIYDSIVDFGYSYPVFCHVIEKGKHGYLNYKGEVIITPKYEEALSFSNNRAFVQINGECGYINKNGEVVIPCKYKWSGWSGFDDGIAWVLDNEGYKQIDTNGVVISPKCYSQILSHSWSQGRSYYKARDKKGIVYVGNYGKVYTSEKEYVDDTEGMLEAARKGSIGEQRLLYKRLLSEKDSVNSFELCYKAAQAMSPEIWTDLAKKYYYGIGVKKNNVEAYKWFVKAANMYNDEALRYVGWMLWEGQGCKTDRNKALEMEHRSLLAGNNHAYDNMRKLGMDLTNIKPY